jgi:hypothetical protein
MNYTIMLIIILLFIALSIAASFIVNSRHMKTHFKSLDDHRLIEAHVRARYLKKRIFISQYSIFVLLLVLIAVTRLRMLFYPALILFLCLLLLRGFFAGLDLLTTTEIEYRKFKKDKAGSH